MVRAQEAEGSQEELKDYIMPILLPKGKLLVCELLMNVSEARLLAENKKGDAKHLITEIMALKKKCNAYVSSMKQQVKEARAHIGGA